MLLTICHSQLQLAECIVRSSKAPFAFISVQILTCSRACNWRPAVGCLRNSTETLQTSLLQMVSLAAVEAQQTAVAGVCSVCNIDVSKYKCPGCQEATCSLACVKQHKQQTGCSGKRDKLAFVPMQQFTDSHLMSGKVILPALHVDQQLLHSQ